MMWTGRKFAVLFYCEMHLNLLHEVTENLLAGFSFLMVLTFVCSQGPTLLLGSTLPKSPVSLMSEADVQFHWVLHFVSDCL